MNSQKVKEIKIVLKGLVDDASNWLQNAMIGGVNLADILTLINELESENERLEKENKRLNKAINNVQKGFDNGEFISKDCRISALKQFADKIKTQVYLFLQAKMFNEKYYITGNPESDIYREQKNQNIGILKAQDILSKWFKVKIDELLKEYENEKSRNKRNLV